MEGLFAVIQAPFVFGVAIPWGQVRTLMLSVFVITVVEIATSRGGKANK